MNRALNRSGMGLLAAAVLLAANVVVPLIWGDVYPFTSAPMFRDSPRQFCNYRVYDANGNELDGSNWLVHRIYDGNPVSYGVGVRPPPVIEQEFGVIHDEATMRRHFEEQLAEPRHAEIPFVDVVQEVIGPIADGGVGVIATHRWRIGR